MPRRVAAGGRPERASSWTIFCDLQACISEPVRIVHYALVVVRRLFLGAEREAVNTADERTGEKESAAADYDDYNQQLADDDLHGGDDELHGSDDELHGSYLHCSDDDDLSDYEGYDDEEDDLPPPCIRNAYDGDSPAVEDAYCFSRYLVELLSVRPHFPFMGTFACFNDRSAYYFSSPKGQQYGHVDSQGNMIIWAKGLAIEDGFRVRVEIPEDDNKIEVANFNFTVDPYACNRVITRTIPTEHLRKIDLTFVPLNQAIQANVFVCLHLIAAAAAGGGGSSTGDTVYYVYGEITAHHQYYGDKNVMLFYREEGNKIKVIGGKLPLLRPWAAVPVYLDPLLVIKLSLHVATDPQHDPVSFQGDLAFDRGEYEKSICNVHHGEVKVRIFYG